LKLSVIDQSPVSAGSTPADALRNSIELARLADRLGYDRYWIAEHHAITALASPAPEILMTRVAAETSGIRVGSGGVMLPHYSPLKVAETFRMLHALYPGRIDLGVGRAPGGTPLDTFALQRYRGQQLSSDDFPQQLLELMAFLNHDFPAKHPFSRLTVSPDMPGCPEVWLLGSSLERGGRGALRVALRVRAFYRFQSDPQCAGALFFALYRIQRVVRAVRDDRAGRALRRHGG
jgi:luciferase family oxidoreductase group 1